MTMQLSRDGYFCAGRLSSFPEVESTQSLCEPASGHGSCATTGTSIGCKVFQVSKEPLGEVAEVEVTNGMVAAGDQVLVFKYKGKVYAVDQRCPHSSAPLSDGVIFDIEDFGVALSSGITCPKHMWSFDLTTGVADRGNYRLKTWQVQLRPLSSATTVESSAPSVRIDGLKTEGDQEVWVRRRPRIG